jgi:hypothetical protein
VPAPLRHVVRTNATSVSVTPEIAVDEEVVQ